MTDRGHAPQLVNRTHGPQLGSGQLPPLARGEEEEGKAAWDPEDREGAQQAREKEKSGWREQTLSDNVCWAESGLSTRVSHLPFPL